MNKYQKVYKMASVFLQYPNKDLHNQLPEIKNEIATINSPIVKTYLLSFAHYLQSTPYDQLCEQYVNTFDFHGIVTLNLTYKVFKDSRERGQALVKLREIFSSSELPPMTDELPDYLPMIFEFLAVAEEENVQKVLKLHLNSIKRLEEDLMKKDSDYHFLLKATIETSLEWMRELQVS